MLAVCPKALTTCTCGLLNALFTWGPPRAVLNCAECLLEVIAASRGVARSAACLVNRVMRVQCGLQTTQEKLAEEFVQDGDRTDGSASQVEKRSTMRWAEVCFQKSNTREQREDGKAYLRAPSPNAQNRLTSETHTRKHFLFL